MKPTIKAKLIKALKSKRWLLNLKDKDAPLCEILPDGRHRFSPAGVLCDLAPKEVADWQVIVGREVWCCGHWRNMPFEVNKWAYFDGWIGHINGHRTLSATIKAIEEL